MSLWSALAFVAAATLGSPSPGAAPTAMAADDGKLQDIALVKVAVRNKDGASVGQSGAALQWGKRTKLNIAGSGQKHTVHIGVSRDADDKDHLKLSLRYARNGSQVLAERKLDAAPREATVVETDQGSLSIVIIPASIAKPEPEAPKDKGKGEGKKKPRLEIKGDADDPLGGI